MARIVALDFGTKRTGIAVTDELQLIASALTTVETNTLLSFLETYFSKEPVSLLVVGEPKQMDNTASESERSIQKFLETFKKKFPMLPVVRVDERFTSKIAMQSLIASVFSKKKRQDKALLDAVSATLILQNYLASKA